MNARVKVPTKPMTAVEPARHSRLGGGGSSTIRQSLKSVNCRARRFVYTFSTVNSVRIFELHRRLEYRRDIRYSLDSVMQTLEGLVVGGWVD